MIDHLELLRAWTDVLVVIAQEKAAKGLRRSRAPDLEAQRECVTRDFRRAVTASITELDANLLEDLMRVIKKVGKEAAKDDNGFDNLLKMTFQLMELAVGKATPKAPDHLVWLFSKLYQGLKAVLNAELMTIQRQEGGNV